MNLATWLGLVLSAAGSLLPWNLVHAQTIDATDQAAVRSYDIPAGPLSTSLATFASQSGLLLSFDPALTRGLNAPALSGSHAARAGLERLLAGSGLEAVVTPSGNYTLQRRLPSGASGEAGATLPVVTVSASGLRDGMTEGTGSYTTTGSSSAATGLNLSLRETPQSVTVITRQRMDDQALDSFQKVWEQAPGVSFHSSTSGVGAYTEVRARGYQINNYQVDGVTIPASVWGAGTSASVDTVIYDSVTVVRGATGLLTGAGDPSGSISLTRKRPTESFQASVTQSLGRWNQRRTVGDVGGPLNAAGTLRGRFVAAYDEGDSWVDRYHGDKTVAYGVLEADLGNKTTLSVALEHARQSGDGAGIYANSNVAFSDGSPTPFSVHDNFTTGWSYSNHQRTTVSAALEHRFNENWQGKLSYSHGSADGDFKLGYAGAGRPDPDGTNQMWLMNNRDKDRVDVLDGKLNGRFTLWGRQHELVAGINVSDSDRTSPRSIFEWIPSGVALDGVGSYPEPDWTGYPNDPTATTTKQSGAYLATRLRATDDLSLIGGLRWSRWQTRSRSLNTGAVTDDRKENSVFTPYAAVVYDLTKQLSAYASYTTIFNPQNYKDVTGRMLDPEKGKNVEMGLKGEWLDGRLNTSAALFRSGKDNLAIADGTNLASDGTQAYIAADDTKARGWELEVAGQLAPGWELQGSYTRTLLKDSSCTPLNTDRSPKHQLKLFTTWKPASIPRLTVGGGVLWQSKIYDDSDPAFAHLYVQKSYAVVNLMANYAFDRHWSLAVRLNNVFDKSYRVLSNHHYYSAPRNLYATLKYTF